MANPDFLIKRNDTLPAMRLTLRNPDGTLFNPTNSTLSLFFQDVDLDPVSGAKQTGAGTFTVVGTGSTGEVDYEWAAADTDTIGSYRAEVEAKPTAGGRLTFPGGGYLFFDVVQDLGDA